MSGHSKWATIKRKKAALDAKKGKEFTKISKEITVAAKLGGGDPGANARLRTLLDKARAANMPLDNINRAIKKGTGELPGLNYEEHTYEGYGPAGIAVIVEALTDNKNRTVSDLRRFFSSNGGNLAETGSVGWMFKSLGVIRANGAIEEDILLELLLPYTIKDLKIDNKDIFITLPTQSLEEVKSILNDNDISVESAQAEMVAHTTLCLSDQDLEKVYNFVSELDEYDDVQHVYTNLG